MGRGGINYMVQIKLIEQSIFKLYLMKISYNVNFLIKNCNKICQIKIFSRPILIRTTIDLYWNIILSVNEFENTIFCKFYVDNEHTIETSL